MRRHQFLKGLHQVLQPRTYFEVGVRNGLSLALSRVPSVAVDPFYNLTREIRCDVHLVRTTSDEFFARRAPFAHFERPLVDLAFIDGMHLSEFSLRDFINTERFCHPGSVVVFDDMLPRNVIEAGRGREGSARHGAWAGDVYKVAETLAELRPDLVLLPMDTRPTGTLVVLGLDPANRVLHEAYDDLVEQFVVPDPQQPSQEILDRTGAHSAEDVLASPVWSTIRRARSRPESKARATIMKAFEDAGWRKHG